MRSAALAASLLFALAATGETFGPVIVEIRDGVAVPRDGSYYEHRFNVFNPTAEPHVVRLDLETSELYRGGQSISARTVTVAPRSSALISIPKFTTHEYGSTVRVVVDGDEEGELRGSGLNSSAGSGYSIGRDLLIGRSVEAVDVMKLAPADSGINAVRPSAGPASWSANWIHYSGFSGAVLTPADWNELPRPAQTALLRWVLAGGSLTFIGGEPQGLPLPRAVQPATQHQIGRHGFGTINLLEKGFEAKNVFPPLQQTWRQQALETRYGYQEETPIPLLDDAALPVKSLFGVLIVFAVVGGPVNLWALAKKQRRLWIFWTLPLLAILTAALLVGAVIFGEGWVRVQKTTSLTLLDERLGEAATVGWTGFYTTVAPDGEIRFDSGTEVRPTFITTGEHTDWTDGQRFVAGWVGSRLPRGFALRKVEPRRERLPLRREAGQLIAINGLGANITSLWVADENGAVYTAKNVAAGKEIVLARSGGQTASPQQDVSDLVGPPLSWSTLSNRVGNMPFTVLQRGSYVAVVERSPFVETALARPTKSVSNAVIVGFMKGIDNAS